MVGTYQLLFYNRQTNLLYIYIYGAAARLLSHLWLSATNPMDYNPPGSSVHEILQARLQELVVISSSRMYTHTYICIHACMPSCFSRVWLFAAPWTVARQIPLPMELFRQEYWSGLPWPSPGDLPDPHIESGSPVALVLQADSFLLSHQGSPYLYIHINNAHVYILYVY